MSSLDLGHIEEASRATDEHSSWEVELRYGMQSTFIEDSGSVRDALAAFKDFPYLGMELESLELLVRV